MSSVQTEDGDVTIRLLKEDIIQVKADVCVTSIHRTKDMKNGVLSSQILRQAGGDIQTEADKINSGGDMLHGQVEELSAGRLSSQFKKLLAVCLYRWRPGNETILERAVAECLTLANALEYESIVLPALGMGQGYPADVVAKAIMSTIVNYRALHPDSKLTTISVTLYDKKDDAIKAFFQASTKFFKEHEQTEGGASLEVSQDFHQVDDMNQNTAGQNQNLAPTYPPSSSSPPSGVSKQPTPSRQSQQRSSTRQPPPSSSSGPPKSNALQPIVNGFLSILKSLSSGMAVSGQFGFFRYKIIPDISVNQKSVGVRFEIHFKLP